MKIDFPQFRKYNNELSYFKIIDDITFIEYKRLGSKIERFEFKAKILPDRNFLFDMLYNYKTNWIKIDEVEFKHFLTKFEIV